MNSRTLIASACIGAALVATSINASADQTITGNVYGTPLQMQITNRTAGAFSSLVYRGTEFLDSADHGRELQSASQFDGFVECLNPTEGGSVADGSGPSTTSVLLSSSTPSANRLLASTQMAYWEPAGASYPQGCGDPPKAYSAQNTTNLSGHVLSKDVTIGAVVPNAIEYWVTFQTAEAHGSAVFEALTGYMPTSFSQFLTYDPKTLTLTSVSPSGEQPYPGILSTPDGSYAMGIYLPPQAGFAGYGLFNKQSTMKWNAVFRLGAVPAGSYSFRNFVIVGTRAQVMQSISAIYQTTQSSINNVYRFSVPWTGEHFFTSSAAEGSNNGYLAESVGFMVMASQVGGTTPLYRCFNGSMHFASTAPDCEGTSNEGAYGYIYGGQVAGSVPLYRFYRTANGDHLETTNYNEGVAAGYSLDGVLGYVPNQSN